MICLTVDGNFLRIYKRLGIFKYFKTKTGSSIPCCDEILCRYMSGIYKNCTFSWQRGRGLAVAAILVDIHSQFSSQIPFPIDTWTRTPSVLANLSKQNHTQDEHYRMVYPGFIFARYDSVPNMFGIGLLDGD